MKRKKKSGKEEESATFKIKTQKIIIIHYDNSLYFPCLQIF
jgi:hypothetical protein